MPPVAECRTGGGRGPVIVALGATAARALLGQDPGNRREPRSTVSTSATASPSSPTIHRPCCAATNGPMSSATRSIGDLTLAGRAASTWDRVRGMTDRADVQRRQRLRGRQSGSRRSPRSTPRPARLPTFSCTVAGERLPIWLAVSHSVTPSIPLFTDLPIGFWTSSLLLDLLVLRRLRRSLASARRRRRALCGARPSSPASPTCRHSRAPQAARRGGARRRGNAAATSMYAARGRCVAAATSPASTLGLVGRCGRDGRRLPRRLVGFRRGEPTRALDGAQPRGVAGIERRRGRRRRRTRRRAATRRRSRRGRPHALGQPGEVRRAERRRLLVDRPADGDAEQVGLELEHRVHRRGAAVDAQLADGVPPAATIASTTSRVW